MGEIKCLNCGTGLTMISNAACPACGVRLSHVKISFLAYLGPEDSLAGYQRSYKLVLLKSVFEEYLSSNSMLIKPVVERFRSYYLLRKKHNLLVDKAVEERIANIEESSFEEVFDVIKRNPLNAISKQGFLKADEHKGIFVLQRGIDDLSDLEIQNLLALLDTKLSLYYQKIGSEALSLPVPSVSPAISEDSSPVLESSIPAKDSLEVSARPDEFELTDEILQSISLEDLDLSNRAYNSLRRNGVHSVAELVHVVSTDAVRQFHNIGAKTVDELTNIVNKIKTGRIKSPGTELDVPPTLSGITPSIDTVFSENGFNLFRAFCAEKGISSLEELASFDFDQLYSISGFGSAKVDRVKERARAALAEHSISIITPSPAKSPSNAAFEAIHDSNLDLPIESLHYFDYSSKAIHVFFDAEITTLRALQEIGFEGAVKLIGRQKGTELCDVLKQFSVPLHQIGENILNECAQDRNFDIYIQRSSGDSLQAVADCFGLTRERIRQICAKFERKILPIMQAIAEQILTQNGTDYFTEEQILDVFDNDNYDKVIVAALKNCSEYVYLDFSSAFVRKNAFPNAEADLQKLAEEIVGDGINLFEKLEEIEQTLSACGYEFVSEDGFLNLLIKHNYKFYGDYVLKTKKSYGLLGAEIVAEEFPDGIQINNDAEISQLRKALEEKYGHLDTPESNRSFITRVSVFLVQRGRSQYISPKNIVIDDSVLRDIKEYIDSLPMQDVYYNHIFAEYEGILMMTSNIDNPGFLHGVLAWKYPDEYAYNRDYLRKRDAAETASLAEQIRAVIVEAGRAVSKKQIFEHFPGLTDAMFNNAFYSSPCLVQWEYGVYNCSDNFSISEDEKAIFRNAIEELLSANNGYCSQEMLHKQAISALPEVCTKNRITTSQNTFYFASLLFDGEFDFSRPHLASKDRFTDLDVKTIAIELLGQPDVLYADKFFALAKKYDWSDVTAGFVFSNIEKEYIRLSKNEYQLSNSFVLSPEDLEYVADLLSWSASESWYLPLQKFSDSEEITPSGLHINEFAVKSIIEKYSLGWHTVTPQSKDRRYEKGILVRNDRNITAYDQLVAEVVSEAGIQTLTASRMLSFLQIHQLTYKTIPKELELSEYFTVSDDQFTVKRKQES